MSLTIKIRTLSNINLLGLLKILTLLLFISFLVGCVNVPVVESTNKCITKGIEKISDEIDCALKHHKINPHFYVLEFTNEGKLTSAEEPARAIREISKDLNINGIIVLSFGWNYDRDTIVKEYGKLLEDYRFDHLDTLPDQINKKAIFVVSWDSKLTGPGHFIGDFIPVPRQVLDYMSMPFTPLTYWSKARQADKIGFGDLAPAMAKIIGEVKKERPQQPLSLYVIAHSFGSRIVTGMVTNDDKDLKDSIKGGLLIQPALTSEELHTLAYLSKSSFPLLVTQSRHDHANRLMFPLLNIPFNSSISRYKGLGFQYMKDIVRDSSLPEEIADYLGFPIEIAISSVMLVPSYLLGQADEIQERGWEYFPDTLAQLPLVEIPVEFINTEFTNLQQSDEYWGQRHKGLFHMGSFHESASTIVTNRTVASSFANLFSDKTIELLPVYSKAKVMNEPIGKLPKGIIQIDMSEEIHKGVVCCEDLGSKWIDWTFGWLDPIGAHTDWQKHEVYQLIDKLVEKPKH